MTPTQLQALREWVRAEIVFCTHELRYPTDQGVFEQQQADRRFRQLELAFKEND